MEYNRATIEKVDGDYIYRGEVKCGNFWKCTQHNEAGGSMQLTVPGYWTTQRVKEYLGYQFDYEAMDNLFLVKKL